MLEYPQVVLDFMNRDHAEFAALRRKLLDMLEAQAPAEKVDTALDELHDHTRRHFAEEERMMKEVAFPPYPVHRGEHLSVLADMADHIEKWHTERDASALRAWLEKPVGEWLVNHISTMDHATAGFIKMNQ